jgi:hypothetical protein
MVSTPAALAAVHQVAAQYGVSSDDATVLRDLTNLLVRLDPTPIVARVQTITAEARDPLPSVARAIAVTDFLARADLPVAVPSDELPPGPHVQDGWVISFWRWYDHDPDLVIEPTRVAHDLHDIHLALREYQDDQPPWDPLLEAGAVLATVDDGPQRDLVAAAIDLVVARTPATRPRQLVHGDAHLGNLLHTRRGSLWTDWELAHTGSVAWDLASLVIEARIPPAHPRRVAGACDVVAAYPEPVSEDDIALEVDRYGVFQTAWWLSIQQQRPAPRLADMITERLGYWHRLLG